MSEQVAAPVNTESAGTPQVAEHRQPTIPSPEAIHAKIVGKIREAQKPVPVEKKPEDTPEPKLAIPPKALAEIGRLQGQVRAAEAKAKEHEAFKADAEAAREIRKLWGGTREEKIAALGKIAGKEGIDELAGIVSEFYEGDGAAKPDGESAKPSPAEAALMKTVEALNKRLEAFEARDTEKSEATKKAEATAEAEKQKSFTKGLIERSAERFPLSARPANVAEASELVMAGALAIARRDGIDLSKPVDQAVADRLFDEAMAETEKEYEALSQRFAPVPKKPEFEFSFDASRIRKLAPPAVTPREEKLSADPAKRFQELQALQRKRFENGEYKGR